MKLIFNILLVSVISFSISVNAGTVDRKVVSVGCNLDKQNGVDKVCWVNFSSSISFGGLNCNGISSSKQLRWKQVSGQTGVSLGDEIFTMLVVAQSSSRNVRVGFSNSQCYSNNPEIVWVTLL